MNLPVFADSSLGVSPVLLVLALAFGAWRLISWFIYLSKKSELDAQIIQQQPKTETGPGGTDQAATVCFYRLSRFVGALMPVYIFCDGAPITSLKNGAHAVLKVAPGRHVFSSGDLPASLSLTLEAGRQYFIRTGILELVSPDRARAECLALRSLPEPTRINATAGEPPPLIAPGAASTPPPLPEVVADSFTPDQPKGFAP